MLSDKKISEYRSEVIEKFINIETLINVIISQRYFKKVIEAFFFEVLYDAYCTFSLKRNILKKINPDFKLQNLERLNSIRNYFAHCNQLVFEGPELPTEGQKGKIFDPKNLTKELDFEKLYNEFIKLEKNVNDELYEFYKSLNGISFS